MTAKPSIQAQKIDQSKAYKLRNRIFYPKGWSKSWQMDNVFTQDCFEKLLLKKTIQLVHQMLGQSLFCIHRCIESPLYSDC